MYLTKATIILRQYYATLSTDERRRIENEVNNKLEDYLKKRARDMERTGVVKVTNNNLEVAATGEVPGRPLNQFSMDEHQSNLRIATTVGGTFFGRTESVNDVYVLDSGLNTVGTVLDLGRGEQIFSARFIGDKGYLVTFRQIDPFFVLDLSDPRNPQVKGELKIPGFSSYLHPIDDNTVLGIGRESSQVKISMFDVSNPENPNEEAKYLLDEFWSDIQNTHHAFLLDSENGIFFLPSGQSGYIFSYLNDQIELKRVVSDVSARRAIYLDNYLYVIGDEKIVILNETDWQEVNSLKL